MKNHLDAFICRWRSTWLRSPNYRDYYWGWPWHSDGWCNDKTWAQRVSRRLKNVVDASRLWAVDPVLVLELLQNIRGWQWKVLLTSNFKFHDWKGLVHHDCCRIGHLILTESKKNTWVILSNAVVMEAFTLAKSSPSGPSIGKHLQNWLKDSCKQHSAILQKFQGFHHYSCL